MYDIHTIGTLSQELCLAMVTLSYLVSYLVMVTLTLPAPCITES